MKLVLRAAFARNHFRLGVDGLELSRRRAITLSPRHGAPTVLRERELASA
jgi:hypothetical protein